jgi:hypothetical protein
MERGGSGAGVGRVLVVGSLVVGSLVLGAYARARGTVGPIIFASGEEDVEPVDPGDRFDEGVELVYAFFEFEGLTATDVLSGIWYRNGSAILTQATTLGQVLGVTGDVPDGKVYFSIDFGDRAQPAHYRLELSLNSVVVQTGEFVVYPLESGAEGEGERPDVGPEAHGVPQAPPIVEQLLVKDDFADPSSGWGTVAAENGRIGYEAGRLVFTLEGRNQPAVSVQEGIFGDAVIEVEAASLAGPEDNALGIVARYQDNDNYYAFVVSADGYHAVLHFVDGSLIWDQKWEFDSEGAVEPGMAANDLQLVAEGRSLYFYVNGNLRGAVLDALWTEGQVGVFAAVFDEPGVQVGFDRWRVWSLPTGE